MRTVLLFFPLLLLACSAPENRAGTDAGSARDTTVFDPGPDTASAPTILVFGRIKDAETGEGMERFQICVEDAVSAALVDSATIEDDSASSELEVDYGRSYHLYFTAAFGPTVKKLVNQAGQTRLVVRYMNFHPNSNRAATFLEYAREKGKFWETLDLLFQKQSEWGERHGASPSAQADVPKVFEKFAGQLGFDWTEIHSAYKENKYRQIFDRDMADGRSIGVRQTPTIFVNGRRLLSLTESDLKMLIDAELAK